MCCRYTQTQRLKDIVARFAVSSPWPPLAPRYNISPSQRAPVVIEQDGHRLELFRWGLIPSWAQSAAIGDMMINAQAETVMENRTYEKLFKSSRCLVVADGFYEWEKRHGGKGKTPNRIVLKSGGSFAMAGLWDTWEDSAGRVIESFAILTTDASQSLKPIHDRMPVILDPKAEDIWLDPKADPQRLLALLVPYDDRSLVSYEVSPVVNSPVNDGPQCIERMTS